MAFKLPSASTSDTSPAKKPSFGIEDALAAMEVLYEDRFPAKENPEEENPKEENPKEENPKEEEISEEDKRFDIPP